VLSFFYFIFVLLVWLLGLVKDSRLKMGEGNRGKLKKKGRCKGKIVGIPEKNQEEGNFQEKKKEKKKR